jgi:hypothetical protein
MNGTESQFQYNNSKTDTENILQLCVDNKMDLIKTVRKLKSVFLGYTKDKVFTVKNYGELKMIIDNKAVIFASEFPVIYFDKMTVFDAPDYWSNKKKVDLLSLKQAKYHEEYDWWQNYTYQTKFKKL